MTTCRWSVAFDNTLDNWFENTQITCIINAVIGVQEGDERTNYYYYYYFDTMQV